ARNERVVTEMPPGVVGELLGPAIDLPLSADVEGFVVHEKNAAGRFALGIAERGDVNAFRSAMDRVRPRVAGFLGDFLGFEHPYDFRTSWIRLGIENVDAR